MDEAVITGLAFLLLGVPCLHDRVEATTAATPATPKLLSSSMVTPTQNSSIPQHTGCADKITTCSQYGHAPCTDHSYEQWAKQNCALYCGFCTPSKAALYPTECLNKIPNCDEFDDGTLCTAASYHPWAFQNCRGYCHFGKCNESACEDLDGMDCASLDGALNFCADIQKAKRVCRKYCKLCDLVDGKWSSWSSWDGCSATCGNGTQKRQRQCNNPAPAHDGLNCHGDDHETQACTGKPCPVHGYWGAWSEWGTCSVTCGQGLQRRDRYCNNPYPSLQGDHCFGTPIGYKACVHNCLGGGQGQWSQWSEWSHCAKCWGLKFRERNCTSSVPGYFGQCDGSGLETGPCSCSPNTTLTKVRLSGGSTNHNGRLEVFHSGTWGTVCDDAFTNQAALIVCNMLGLWTPSAYFTSGTPPHPISAPTQIWLDDVVCSGSETDIASCRHDPWGTNNCGHGEDVIIHCYPYGGLYDFTAINPVDGHSQNNVIFSKLLTSDATTTNYNITTGQFTCTYRGSYVFTLSLTKSGLHGNSDVHCFLRLNGGNMVLVHINPGGYSASTSVTWFLEVGDKVDVGGCSGVNYLESASSVFTGHRTYT